MWISKEASERRNEILDCALKLFNEKGYDATSITDILNAVGIARGTLYYHFKSKEEILEGIVERIKDNLVSRASSVLEDSSLELKEKILKTLLSLNIQGSEDIQMFTEIHKPQNALMEQKILGEIIKDVTPILAKLIEEGNEAGIFNCSFPYESAELFLTYGNVAFDSDIIEKTEQNIQSKVEAFVVNMERVFGAEKGSLEYVKQMFERL